MREGRCRKNVYMEIERETQRRREKKRGRKGETHKMRETEKRRERESEFGRRLKEN